MADKDGDSAVIPIRARRPVTAAELTDARVTLRRAQAQALELVTAVLGDCPQHPGVSASALTALLPEPEREAARRLLDALDRPAVTATVA